MTNIIEQLRKYDGYEGIVWDETHEEINILLDGYKIVHTEFEDGGRWSNFKTEVYEVKEDNETAYFRIVREVPATEIQEGADFYVEFSEAFPREITFSEVFPKEITTIVYE